MSLAGVRVRAVAKRSYNASLYVLCGNGFASLLHSKSNAAGSIVETFIFRVWIISGDVYLLVHTQTRTQSIA